jgi:hypothetical protein
MYLLHSAFLRSPAGNPLTDGPEIEAAQHALPHAREPRGAAAGLERVLGHVRVAPVRRHGWPYSGLTVRADEPARAGEVSGSNLPPKPQRQSPKPCKQSVQRFI